MENYVYILSCADGTLYTGWTNHLEKRVETHNRGKGAKYTKSRLPVKLVYWEVYEDKIEAMKREAAIKKLTRKKKQELILASKNGTKGLTPCPQKRDRGPGPLSTKTGRRA